MSLSFEKLLEQIQLTNPPGYSVGWLDDAHHFFSENDAWAKAHAFEKNDVDCQLELKSVISSKVDSLNQLANIQRKIWHELSYRYFELSELVFYKECSVLRFVTIMTPTSQSCVGRMVAGGAHYQALTEGRTKLTNAPFVVDFGDVDEMFEVNRKWKLEQADRVAAEKVATIQQLEACVLAIETFCDTSRSKFLNSSVTRDAVLFNFERIWRGTSCFADPNIKQWRKELLPVLKSVQYGPADPDAVWITATEHVPLLKPLLHQVAD